MGIWQQLEAYVISGPTCFLLQNFEWVVVLYSCLYLGVFFVVTNPDAKASHLGTLIQQADKKVNDFTASIVNCTSDNKVGQDTGTSNF